MRIFLSLLLAALVWSGTAYAGANLIQQDDGTTVWRNADSEDWPVGDPGLTVTIEDISSAATDYVFSHRPGLLTKIYVVPSGAFDANSNESTLDFGVDLDGDGNFTDGVFGAAHTLTVATGTAGVGSTLTITTGYTVGQGDVISIHTDGGSTGATAGTVTIVIE